MNLMRLTGVGVVALLLLITYILVRIQADTWEIALTGLVAGLVTYLLMAMWDDL